MGCELILEIYRNYWKGDTMRRCKLVSCVLTAILLSALLPGAAYASPAMTLYKDGVDTDLPYSPFIIDGHPGIYLRDAALLFDGRYQEGADVSYLWIGQREFIFYHNMDSYMVDGYKRQGSFTNYSNGTSTLIPLDTMATETGYQIEVDTIARVVDLKSPSYLEMLRRPSIALETEGRQEILMAAAPGLEHWGIVRETPALMDFVEGTPFIEGYYTRLHGTWERTNNIQISSTSIRGTILQPGAVFSFNDVVGPRSPSYGYEPAPIFSGDAVISGYGGGICQVASTLYNVVLLSGLPVLERHRHSQDVIYVPDGQDATVSWGSADFQFQNSYEYPIEIYAKQFDNYLFVGFFKMD